MLIYPEEEVADVIKQNVFNGCICGQLEYSLTARFCEMVAHNHFVGQLYRENINIFCDGKLC